MKIQIIATPPGQAPLPIREKWVGVEIPLSKKLQGGIQLGVDGGAPQNLGGYTVEVQDAIRSLKAKAPEAAQWWEERLPASVTELVFKKEVCKLIS